tara:strand:- start:3003 stop:3128 length:126 start_codon:yes stop_codon:yes gene_type:complete
MTETDIFAFAMWSGITAILMTITGFVYKNFKWKKTNESTAS